MYVDNETRVSNAQDVSGADPTYSSAIELNQSPDMGLGGQLVAVIEIDSYDPENSGGTDSTGTNFDIVSSAVAGLTSPKLLGRIELSAAEITARIGNGRKGAPITVRIQPDATGFDVSGVDEKYLGIRYDHKSAAPATMTVTAYFVHDFQADPRASHFQTGAPIL